MNACKQYAYAVERRLRLDRPTRRRVMNDLASDLQSRLDAGATMAEIEAELGSPEVLAESLNAAFPAHRRTASPWRWVFAAGAALLVLRELLWQLPDRQASVGVIGGADGPTAVYVAGGLPDVTVLCLLFALTAGFVFLGWCRGGSPRRYWAAVALSVPACLLAVVLLAGAVQMQAALAGTGATLAAVLRSVWLPAVLRSGLWLSVPVLVLAVRRLRAARPTEDA